jgi:hypothetical protein
MLDEWNRLPPPILEMMSYVWQGKPVLATEEYRRVRAAMEEDPKGFMTQLVAMETAFQKQLAAGAARDRRIREMETKVAELEGLLEAGGKLKVEEKDKGQQRVLELIEQLQTDWREQIKQVERLNGNSAAGGAVEGKTAPEN